MADILRTVIMDDFRIKEKGESDQEGNKQETDEKPLVKSFILRLEEIKSPCLHPLGLLPLSRN